MQKPTISIIAALGHNQVLGRDNQLLWHIPEDLKRFKALTLGHPVIMGRKTFESIVAVIGKPLPGRTSIVVTRDLTWSYDGVVVVHSVEEGIEKAKEFDQVEIFIGGGGEIYRQALPYVDRLYLTLIDDTKEGDSFFPEFQGEFTRETFREECEWGGIKYSWVNLEREN